MAEIRSTVSQSATAAKLDGPVERAWAKENHPISVAAFSHIVGLIYDCALDPKRWPDALREICGAANCAAGLFVLHDLDRGSLLVSENWNYASDWLKRMPLYGDEIAGFWNSVPDLHSRSLDDPLIASHDLDPDMFHNSRFFREGAMPRGLNDSVQLIVMRRPLRVGALGLARHESAGIVTKRDLAILSLLAPHIRHSVAISDILDQQAIMIGTFEASLDAIKIGVVLVDRDAVIIYANRAAQNMFNAGFPIRSERGQIRAYLSQDSAALRSAIAAAATDETAMGSIRIGVPTTRAHGGPALIHVLPLTNGKVRTRLAPRATAALFITMKIDDLGSQTEILAIMFGLTPAESRLLAHIIEGNSLADTAKTLGIAITTAKTHLAHIFDKTGTSRQAELVSLAGKFSPPIGRSKSGE